RVVGDAIECGYHGFTFNSDGNCILMPGLEKTPPKVCVRSYPVTEKWGWIFVWMGEADQADEALIPDYHWLDDPEWVGKGGTMHVADWAVGMHGGNGIIGASAPHALGAAFSAKFKKTGGVAVAFGGDGASNQGAVFEAMNFAKAYALPVVFVLEDNGYAESTHKTYTTAGDPVSRAAGLGIPA
ncbi:MAG TPA: hypothetical protein EYQ81_07430, partial [Sneathiellales bacterium]|nr:hypothetical protein [Sneathiellales bacterium]